VGEISQLVYDIRELVAQSAEFVYDIRQLVPVDSEITWDIRQLIDSDLEAKYDILLNVARSVQMNYDIREAVGDEIVVIYDVAEHASRIATLVYSILRLEEPAVITRSLREALLADLQQITIANGFKNTLADVTKYPKPIREMKAPCVSITEGGSGEAEIETIGNRQGLATQSFNLIAAVRSMDGPEAMDDLLDDIRNAIERTSSNLFDLAIVATVDSWGEILTDRDVQGQVYWRPVTVRCEYAYNRGTA
jgi:hypothetical protein